MTWNDFIENRLGGKKADILLINPPLNLDCGVIENPVKLSPPLGLGYLATIAQQAGLRTAILDAEAMQLAPCHVVKAIRTFQPDVVGFSVVTPAVESVRQIVRSLEASNPLLIAGGIHPTVMPEHMLDVVPDLDLVVQGEAEKVWQALCQVRFNVSAVLKEPAFQRSVEVRCYKETVIIRPIHPPVLKTIPRLDHGNFVKVALLRDEPLFEYTVLGARGCAFRCKFCAAAAFRGYRVFFRDINDLMDEIETYAVLGPPRFHLVDDNTLRLPPKVVPL